MSKKQAGLETAQKSVKGIHLEEMYPVICEVLSGGGKFSLTITGTSMFPTILGGRDQVTLVRPPERLQKYDLPLYRRRNGQFVLHRVVAVEEDGSYTCCGDHQWVLEKGICQEQVVGLATDLVRKGKAFPADHRPYVRWVRFWVWMLPCRHFLFRVYHSCCRVKSRLGKAARKVFSKKN